MLLVDGAVYLNTLNKAQGHAAEVREQMGLENLYLQAPLPVLPGCFSAAYYPEPNGQDLSPTHSDLEGTNNGKNL